MPVISLSQLLITGFFLVAQAARLGPVLLGLLGQVESKPGAGPNVGQRAGQPDHLGTKKAANTSRIPLLSQGRASVEGLLAIAL